MRSIFYKGTTTNNNKTNALTLPPKQNYHYSTSATVYHQHVLGTLRTRVPYGAAI